MPLKIKGHLGNRFFIGEIENLLEKNGSKHGIELFGRAPLIGGEKGSHPFHGQFGKDFFPEQPSPRFIQEFAPFGSQIAPWIEKLTGFAVFGIKHAFSL
jgi:hypothetical protein